MTDLFDQIIELITRLDPGGGFFSQSFNVRALIALVLVSLCCGAVGSLVVGSRMAFFSDALAHCAFAGVSVGYVLFELLVRGLWPGVQFWDTVPWIMAGFGVLVGCGIAYVRSQTGLASDTVIGVFFAGAIGLAAMLQNLFQRRQLFSLEDFLFGNPLRVDTAGLVVLTALLAVTVLVLAALYNSLLLASFNPSLALSRNMPVQAVNYLFVILLALIVNLCLRTVGVLLINALLVVPAAAAANFSRNMRQFYWWTIAISLAVSLAGLWLSWEVEARTAARGQPVQLGISGTVVLLCVLLFVVSMLAGPLVRRRVASPLPTA